MRKAAKDPLTDAKAAERWIATFNSADPLALHVAVLGELARAADPGARHTPSQLEAVFALDARTAELRSTLTAQYVEHANRSSRIETQLWSALFDLAQAFLLAYQSFTRELSAGAIPSWQSLLPELVARQIVQLGLDAKVRMYRFEQWIPAKWSELHGLLSLALSRKFERQYVSLDVNGAHTTIEHEYIFVLLLQLIHSGNMTPKHLDYVAHELRDWSQPLRLTLEASSVTSFYVDLAGREGLKRRRTPAPLEGRVLFVDTGPLHSVLRQHILVLDQKLKSQPQSERTTKRAEQLNLLTKLASQVDPEYRPFARRGERTAATGTADAIVGFAHIASYLRDEERDPVSSAKAGKSFGGTMELAVFGRVLHEQDRIHEQARRRLIAVAAKGGPWEVKDVSQTGYRLVAPMAVANVVTLGTVVALHAHGKRGWTLGVVRRIRRVTSERAEIGLQNIASALLGVDLIEQRKSAEGDYSVDGELATINGRTFPGLLLAVKKRDSDTPVLSLMLAAVEYQPSRKLKLQTSKLMSPVRLGRILEQQPEWVWTAIEPMNSTLPLPEIAIGAAE
ncbi:MAG TPA: hypothetical protein VNG69_11480 [Casimicrobiaceae bacterium]|nr:hypothetical protein [Casimicrobiaceae bacterium]